MFDSNNHREFQRGLDCDKARASRRDAQLSLRRKQREAHLQKKVRLNRNTNKPKFYGEIAGEIENPSFNDINKYVANIMQTDNEQLHLKGVTAIRQILSVERSPPTKRVLNSGVVPKIVQFMFTTNDDRINRNNRENTIRNKIKFESAWIITNIAASTTECTRRVCSFRAIEAFVDLLRNSSEPEMADQAIWGLGNIAGDGKDLRDRIINTGVLDDFVNGLPNWDVSMQQNAVWAISNICRYSNEIKISDINKIVPAICKLLRETKDEGIIRDCLWCFCYLSNQTDDILYFLVKNGAINDCMKLLHQEIGKYQIALNQIKQREKKQQQIQMQINGGGINNKPLRNATKDAMLKMNDNIYRPSLRFLGNILTGNDELTQKVLDCGYLDIIEPFAYHFVAAQRKETIWAISNICAGSHQQIEYILSRPKLINAIMDAAISDKLTVRREACWCICNAAADAIGSQIKILVEYGAIEALCNILHPQWTINENNLLSVLEGLEAFLKVYANNGRSGYNPYRDQIEECQGLDFLEERMADTTNSEYAYNQMVDLVEKYWGKADDPQLVINDNNNITSLNANIDKTTNQFQFGCHTNNENINNQNFGNRFRGNNNVRFQF